MFPWWDSLESVSHWSTVANWSVAILGLVVLLLGRRESQLQEKESNEANRTRDELISQNNRETAEARRDAAQANERSANTTERAAKLEKEAAEAKLELEKLRDRQKPRTISQEQKNKFLELVKEAQKGQIHVYAAAQESEILNFATQLKSLFSEAGYAVSGSSGIGGDGGEGSWGVQLQVHSIDKCPLHGRPLQDALTAIGLTVGGYENENVPEGQVKIAVARKP